MNVTVMVKYAMKTRTRSKLARSVECATSWIGSNYAPHLIFPCSAQICLLGVGTIIVDHTCAGASATNTVGSAAAVSADADTTEASSTDTGTTVGLFVKLKRTCKNKTLD